MSSHAGNAHSGPPVRSDIPSFSFNEGAVAGEIFVTRKFTWIPDGPLADNPAPMKEASQTSIISGGPIKAILSGSGHVGAIANFVTGDGSVRTISPVSAGTTNTPEAPSPGITQAPTSPFVTDVPNGYISFDPATQQLNVIGRATASNSSSWSLRQRATGTTEFNQIKIRISDITLKP